MMFTEDEAQDKACCATAARIDGGKIAHGICLASSCMAWRKEYGTWHITENRFLKLGDTYQPEHVEKRETGRGYCGIVGRPE